jgi:CHAT domain-containing protein
MIRIPATILLLASLLLCGCKTPSILVTEEQRLGDLCSNNHEYEQAIYHYQNVLDASLKLGIYRNLDMEADVSRKIAQAYSLLGDYKHSVDYVSQALEKDSLQLNELEMIEDYRELGKYYLFLGDIPRGRAYLEKVLAMNLNMENSRKGINRLSAADTYLTLSELYSVMGNVRQGESYGLSALKIYSGLDDETGKMESLLQLGKIHLQLGSGNTAQAYIQSSLELAGKLDAGRYRHYQALAQLNEQRSDYEEALRLKLHAIEEVEQTNNLPQTIWAYMLTGDLYVTIGDRERAREYYNHAMEYIDSSHINARALEASASLRAGELDQAYNYFSSAGLETAAGISGMRLGELALEWDLEEEALGHFMQSLGHFENTGWAEGIARARTMLGITLTRMKEFSLARKEFSDAKKKVQYDESRWRLWYALGLLQEAQNQPDSAINAYIEAVEVIERIRGNFTVEEFKSIYLEDKMEVYDRLIRLLMNRERSDEALNYSERARSRAFLDMIGNQRIVLSQGNNQEFTNLEQDLRLEIQSLSKLLQKEEMGLTRGLGRQQIEGQIRQARDQYVRVITEIKLFNPEYAAMVDLETADLSALQQKMDPGLALLVYWVGRDNLHIWLVSSTGISGKTLPVDEDRIIDLVSHSRRSVGSRKYKEEFSSGYRYLIAPFKQELEAYETLGIVPHLSLHFLPFQCLMPDSSSYLIDRYELFYTPSLSVYGISEQKEIHPEKGLFALALGGLELSGLPAIPGTTVEVSRISQLFSEPDATYGRNSTETFFKDHAGPYEFIHLATHGILDYAQPMFSYLVLAPTDSDDGLLTVSEVFSLDLNAKMVVLSACETGLGTLSSGDEIIGLSRAFLFSGARNVIVSLWSVADEPTAYLMTRFYSELHEHEPVQALQIAQVDTRNKYGYPLYWAPFQLIGTGH